VPAHGTVRARWWYRGQVARSIMPLLFRAWQRASLTRASTAVVVAATLASVPATLLMMVRTFVLQQVPLKTTSELSAAFAAALLSLVLFAGVLGIGAAIQLLNADARER
jgi:hypothetical protein